MRALTHSVLPMFSMSPGRSQIIRNNHLKKKKKKWFTLTAGWLFICLATTPNMDGIVENLPPTGSVTATIYRQNVRFCGGSLTVSRRPERPLNCTPPPLLSANSTMQRQQMYICILPDCRACTGQQAHLPIHKLKTRTRQKLTWYINIYIVYSI